MRLFSKFISRNYLQPERKEDNTPKSNVQVRSVTLAHQLEYLIIKKCWEHPLNTNRWCLSLTLVCHRFFDYISNNLMVSFRMVTNSAYETLTKHLSSRYCPIQNIRELYLNWSLFNSHYATGLLHLLSKNIERLNLENGGFLTYSDSENLEVFIRDSPNLRELNLKGYVKPVFEILSKIGKNGVLSLRVNDQIEVMTTGEWAPVLQLLCGLKVLKMDLVEYDIPIFSNNVFYSLEELELEFSNIEIMSMAIPNLSRLSFLKSLALRCKEPSYEPVEFDPVNELFCDTYLKMYPALTHLEYSLPASARLLQLVTGLPSIQSLALDCSYEIVQFPNTVESLEFLDITSILLKKFLTMSHPSLLILKLPKQGHSISNSIQEVADFIQQNKSLIHLGLNEPQIISPLRIFKALAENHTLRSITLKKINNNDLCHLLTLTSSSTSLSSIYLLDNLGNPEKARTKFKTSTNRLFKLKAYESFKTFFFKPSYDDEK